MSGEIVRPGEGSPMGVAEALGIASSLRQFARPALDGSIASRQAETVLALADALERLTTQAREVVIAWVDPTGLDDRDGIRVTTATANASGLRLAGALDHLAEHLDAEEATR